MGKFDGILICTDLDGTLYTSEKTISHENKEAIEYFKSEGGAFTFITGRMPNYSLDAYNSVMPNVPFGCINGGGVYDGKTGKYVWTCEMPREVTELVEFVDTEFPNVGIQVCTFDKTYFAKENGAMERFRKITGLPNISRDYREIDEPIAKIIFVSAIHTEMQELDKALRSHPKADGFNFTRSEKTLYEILPKGVNKGLALGKFAEYLGVDIKKTVAVGDFDNDVGMLSAAGLGVAVSNASDMALAAADVVTVSNNEHAIAKVIYDIENGKYNI